MHKSTIYVLMKVDFWKTLSYTFALKEFEFNPCEVTNILRFENKPSGK